MVAAMGASPAFAWANALAPDIGGTADEIRTLVASVSDDRIAAALDAAGNPFETLLSG
jgi:hypothetical protein